MNIKTVVAAILGAVSLLLRTAPRPCASTRVHRFHQSIGAASRIADSETQALPCGLTAISQSNQRRTLLYYLSDSGCQLAPSLPFTILPIPGKGKCSE